MEIKQEYENLNEINWEVLTARNRRTTNKQLSSGSNGKIFCHADYADELLKLYQSVPVETKEHRVGDICEISEVTRVGNDEIQVMLTNYTDATINLKHEKAYLRLLELSEDDFKDSLTNKDGKVDLKTTRVMVENGLPDLRVSLYEGHLSHIKQEFFGQIKNPTTAYSGIVSGKNQGGFIISVQGVNGFLPGSLSAANVVRDFDALIGKTIPVMVEDYLKESNTFVFSHKKYLSHVLPTKVAELTTDKKYEGTITGLTKYGIFVEFDEIFTGLIHTSKMSNEFKERFKNYEFNAGDTVEFWIKEITADKKIILTDEDPSIRYREIEDFGEKNIGVIRGGEVVSVQPFGTLIKLQKDIIGLISQKEIKSKNKKFNVGDTVMVTVDKVHNDKIFLSIPNEN